jgi:hypothetical protein
MLINGVVSNALARGDVGKGLAINAALFAGAKGLGGLTSGVPAAVSQGGTYVPAQNVGNVGVEGLKQNIFAGGGSPVGMTSGVGSVPPQQSALSSAMQFANQNPYATAIGLQTAGNVLFPEQQPMAAATQAGLLRGNPIPLEQQQFASMPPRQPISLI